MKPSHIKNVFANSSIAAHFLHAAKPLIDHIDIHRYKLKLETCERNLQNIIDGTPESGTWKDLSSHNAKLILDFERTCSLVEGTRIPTRIKYIEKLVIFQTYMLLLSTKRH